MLQNIVVEVMPSTMQKKGRGPSPNVSQEERRNERARSDAVVS